MGKTVRILSCTCPLDENRRMAGSRSLDDEAFVNYLKYL
jgi:hypothetical protein